MAPRPRTLVVTGRKFADSPGWTERLVSALRSREALMFVASVWPPSTVVERLWPWAWISGTGREHRWQCHSLASRCACLWGSNAPMFHSFLLEILVSVSALNTYTQLVLFYFAFFKCTFFFFKAVCSFWKEYSSFLHIKSCYTYFILFQSKMVLFPQQGGCSFIPASFPFWPSSSAMLRWTGGRWKWPGCLRGKLLLTRHWKWVRAAGVWQLIPLCMAVRSGGPWGSCVPAQTPRGGSTLVQGLQFPLGPQSSL